MSGHSKWAQIKRSKGVADAKRGQAFTKLANAITIAVRDGGGVADPSQNFRLRLAVDKAREANMPKTNIERAIERGAGKGGNGANFEEAVYEGFGPGHVAIIVDCATDNKNRTNGEVAMVFNKNGGILGNPGAVSYQFEKKGLIVVEKNDKSLDDIFLLAADAGAEDVEEAGEEAFIYTKPEDLARVKDNLIPSGLTIKAFELTRKPTTFVEIGDKETADKVISFIDKLEELDDVQKVYSNFDIAEGLL